MLLAIPSPFLTAIVAPHPHQRLLGPGTGHEQSHCTCHRSHPRRCRAVGFLRTGHRRLSSMARAVGAAACARATLVKAQRLFYAGLGLFAASALVSVRGSIESYFGRVVVFLQCRHACCAYRRVCGLWIMRWLCLDGSRNAPRGEILGRGSQNPSASSPSPASAPLVWCSSPTFALTQKRS